MTDMQTSLLLLIVWLSILNPVINFSTHLWLVKWKCPTNIPLLCAFHSISSNVDATHAPTLIIKWYDPLHIIRWPYWFINLDLTCSSPLPSSIGAMSCSSFTTTRSIAPKPWTCPSCLQSVRQAKSCLDLLHLSHMTQCHVLYELLHRMCEPCNKSKPYSSSWHELLTQVYLWTDHMCISQLNTLVHLGCHSTTKTKQGPFIGPPSTIAYM